MHRALGLREPEASRKPSGPRTRCFWHRACAMWATQHPAVAPLSSQTLLAQTWLAPEQYVYVAMPK
jgi:hypothetical protein